MKQDGAEKYIFIAEYYWKKKVCENWKNLIINNVTIGKKRIMEYCFVAESIYIVLKV